MESKPYGIMALLLFALILGISIVYGLVKETEFFDEKRSESGPSCILAIFWSFLSVVICGAIMELLVTEFYVW